MGNVSRLINARKVREIAKSQDKFVKEGFIKRLEDKIKREISDGCIRCDLAGRKVLKEQDG